MAIRTVFNMDDGTGMMRYLLYNTGRLDIKYSQYAWFKPSHKLQCLWIARYACAYICIGVAELVSLL